MNRKAITEATLALLIIALITMGFLGVFVYNYGERQTCTQKIELCRTSMTILNAFIKAPWYLKKTSPLKPRIDCPICVPGSSDKIKNEEQEKNLHEIAEHLRWCWYKTLGKDNFMLDKKICTVCSEFTIKQQIEPAEFLNYLRTTKIKTGPGAGKTYEEYLDMYWGTQGILDYATFINDPGLPTYLALGTESAQKDLKKQHLLPLIYPAKEYQVINYHVHYYTTSEDVPPFNHIFISPIDAVPKLPCDIYHYQKE